MMQGVPRNVRPPRSQRLDQAILTFLSDLDLSPAASDDIEWAPDHQSFLIKGAIAVDTATEKEQEVNLRMGWQVNTQALGVIQSENVGDPIGGNQDVDMDGVTPPSDCNDADANIRPGVTEICTDSIDNNCNGATDNSDAQCSGVTPQGIQMTLENPSTNPLDTTTPSLGGIGVVSGWAFSPNPQARINSVLLRVDGNVVETCPAARAASTSKMLSPLCLKRWGVVSGP